MRKVRTNSALATWASCVSARSPWDSHQAQPRAARRWAAVMEEVSPVASVFQAKGFAASGIPAPPMCAPGYA